jgi:tetratricopeptide (TPR) repeat protein
VPLWTGIVLAAALGSRAEIAAAGASSPRPASCRPSSTLAVASSLWTRLRPPETEDFCRTLARGYARLKSEPKDALELARRAAELRPGDPAQRLLEGRALLRVGELGAAWKVLGPLFATATLDDAESLHDVARAALVTGELDAAERAYLRLVPRVLLLGSGEARRIAYLEAASLLLARGSRGSDEALGYLAEARAIPLSGDRDLVLALTALAHSRAGRFEQARAAARESDGPWDLENELSPLERARVAVAALPSTGAPEPAGTPETPALKRVMLVDGELHAAIAVLAEGRDAALMRAHLRAFLESRAGKGPWADHARRLLGERGARAP